jgi:hypothetical protein
MMQRVQNCELYTEIVCREKLRNLIVFSSNGTLENSVSSTLAPTYSKFKWIESAGSVKVLLHY